MKTTSRKRKYSVRWLTLCLVVVLVVGGTAFALYHQHASTQHDSSKNTASIRPENTPDYSPAAAQDNTANNARKASSNPAATLDNGSTATTNITLSVQIVSASAANRNIHIGTMVSGATSGTCTLTATQGSTSVALDTTTVKQDVNNYDCGGEAINVPTSQLHPASGTWQLKLTATSGNSQATDTASVTL